MNIYSDFNSSAHNLAHNPTAQKALEVLGIKDIEVVEADSSEEIWSGTATCLEVPAYFNVFWDVANNMDNLVVRLKPASTLALNPSQLNSLLKPFDEVFSIQDPMFEIMTNKQIIRVSGKFRFSGALKEIVSITGLDYFYNAMNIPIFPYDVDKFSIKLKSIISKTLLDCIDINQLALKLYLKNALPRAEVSLKTTYRFPHCSPIMGKIMGGVSTQSEVYFDGSLNGRVAAPFSIPIELNKVGAHLDCLTSSGLTPTGCGLTGKVTLTHEQEKQRSVELGGIYSISTPAFAFKGWLSYLCATDLYNFFPTIIGETPKVIANIRRTLDTYPEDTQLFADAVKHDVDYFEEYLQQMDNLIDKTAGYFKTEQQADINRFLNKERISLQEHLKNTVDAGQAGIEKFHTYALALRHQLEELLGLDKLHEQMQGLAEKIEHAKIPDFFCLSDLFVVVAPQKIAIGDIDFEQGFHLKGTLSLSGLHPFIRYETSEQPAKNYAKMSFEQFLEAVQKLYAKNKSAHVDISVTSKGIRGKGQVSPLRLSFAGTHLLSITHSQNKKEGPEVNIDISKHTQEFGVHGRMKLLNQLESACDVIFDMERAETDVAGRLFGLNMDLHCSASINNLEDWFIEGSINRGLEEPLDELAVERITRNGVRLNHVFQLKGAYFRVALADLATGVLPELNVTVELFGRDKTFALPSFDLKKLDEALTPLIDNIAALV